MKISKTHHKTKKGVIKRNPKRKGYRFMIGDGKFPNKYWVSWANDFYICHDGSCDWASDTQKFKVKGKTNPKAFDTFQKALEYIDDNLMISDVPKTDTVNVISVEDRLSGQIWEQAIYAYRKKNSGILADEGWKFEIETNRDTSFTEEKMRERGEVFK
jgi:hypothetical protein